MFSFSHEYYLILFTLLLCIIITFLLIHLKKLTSRTKKKLQTANISVSQLREQLTAKDNEPSPQNGFDESLNQADITTHLQISRIRHYDKDSSVLPPERYRYIRSLIAAGMSADKIAAILSISPQEAIQLVQLSKLAIDKNEPSQGQKLPSKVNQENCD